MIRSPPQMLTCREERECQESEQEIPKEFSSIDLKVNHEVPAGIILSQQPCPDDLVEIFKLGKLLLIMPVR